MEWCCKLAKKAKNTVVILIVVLAIGVLMRSPITTLPLVIGQLSSNLHVTQSSLGILTTLPLVMFLLFSNFASIPLARIGIKKSMGLALLFLLIGSLCRTVITMPSMIVGTLLIGIGIAHLNVFMPSFIKAYFPEHIDIFTTMYSFSMNLGSAAFNLLTAPVVSGFGWRAILMILAVVPFLVMIMWIFVSKNMVERLKIDRTPITNISHERNIWRNSKAWPFLITFGCQSLLNYTLAAWFPVLMAYHHLDASSIGFIVACYSLMGIPVYIVMPRLLTQLGRIGVRITIFISGACGIVAGVMLFFQNTTSFLFWLTESILIGIAISFFFIYTTTMFGLKTDDPMTTAKLSGMAQAGGYFMAALGPTIYGIAFHINPIGNAQNLVYIVIIMLAIVAALFIQRIDKVK